MRFNPFGKKSLLYCLLFISLGLCQCGGKSKSQDVIITVNPNQPIVFTSLLNFTDNNGLTINITPPWFEFFVNIANNDSTDPLTIVSLHVEATGTDASGAMTTVKQDFSPSSEDFSTLSETCNFNSFGTYTPGGNSTTGPTFNNLLMSYYEVNVDGSLVSSCTQVATFRVGGLPSAPNQTSFAYSVMIKPEGWYGTFYNQTSRFDNQIYVTAE